MPIRQEEKTQGSQLCEECGHKIRHQNWDAHLHYALHPNSELNMLMKGHLRELGNFRRKAGKLKDKLQADIKAEYELPRTEIRKRLNEQFPNKAVDEEETLETQPVPEKPKPAIDEVFDHVHQLLMNDELPEDYLVLFGKHSDNINY